MSDQDPSANEDQPVYRAVPGSGLTDEEAAIIGLALEELARKKGVGLTDLTPDDVVEAARDPKSPLHRFVEWDDEVAV